LCTNYKWDILAGISKPATASKRATSARARGKKRRRKAGRKDVRRKGKAKERAQKGSVDEERGRYGFERPPLDSFIHHVHSSNGHCARVRDARFFRVAKRDTKAVTLAAPQTVNGDINSVCVAASTH